MGKVMRIAFDSSLSDICELNSSFDSGVLKICYTGENRNKTYFSKESLLKSLPTMYNCPVVCNYHRDDGSLGGHDIDVVTNYNGDLEIVNLTHPVGVIPESANTWFEFCEEKDGSVHEYLCADVLLWKRQEAYKRIKEDGIVSHSMEINVKNGFSQDGIYHVEDFEFTAFALIGVEPCFEGSSLKTFSMECFKEELALMMDDMKKSFNMVGTEMVNDIYPQEKSTEGGTVLGKKKLKTFDEDNQSNELEDFGVREIIYDEEADGSGTDPDDNTASNDNDETVTSNDNGDESDDGTDDSEPSADDDDGDDEGSEDDEEGKADDDDDDEPTGVRKKLNDYQLSSAIIGQLSERIWSIERDDEGFSRYIYMDCELDKGLVYCYDSLDDWNIYAFSFSVEGDDVVVDLESKKRMKIAIVEYIEGTSEDGLNDAIYTTNKAYQELVKELEEKNSEIGELLGFKADTERAQRESAIADLTEQFSDLSDTEGFTKLMADNAEYSIEQLEEKLYALRGRLGVNVYALNQNPVRVPAVRVPVLPNTDIETDPNEPYGGLFVKYSVGQE